MLAQRQTSSHPALHLRKIANTPTPRRLANSPIPVVLTEYARTLRAAGKPRANSVRHEGGRYVCDVWPRGCVCSVRGRRR